MNISFVCTVCRKPVVLERLFQSNGHLKAPLVCDLCGIGVHRYLETVRQMKVVQLSAVRECQTRLLAELQIMEDMVRAAERDLRNAELREARLAKKAGTAYPAAEISDDEQATAPPIRDHGSLSDQILEVLKEADEPERKTENRVRQD